MKKRLLFIIVTLISIAGMSQAPDGMVKIDMPDQENEYRPAAYEAMAMTDASHASTIASLTERPRLDSFLFYQENEVDLDTVTINFQVTGISGETAKIISTELGKKYEVPVNPEYNPFGYVLEVDREYTICLERDMNEVYKYQTRGQTKTLPARMIWFTVSRDQLAKDQVQLTKFIESPPGYDRSPRYQ